MIYSWQPIFRFTFFVRIISKQKKKNKNFILYAFQTPYLNVLYGKTFSSRPQIYFNVIAKEEKSFRTQNSSTNFPSLLSLFPVFPHPDLSLASPTPPSPTPDFAEKVDPLSDLHFSDVLTLPCTEIQEKMLGCSTCLLAESRQGKDRDEGEEGGGEKRINRGEGARFFRRKGRKGVEGVAKLSHVTSRGGVRKRRVAFFQGVRNFLFWFLLLFPLLFRKWLRLFLLLLFSFYIFFFFLIFTPSYFHCILNSSKSLPPIQVY